MLVLVLVLVPVPVPVLVLVLVLVLVPVPVPVRALGLEQVAYRRSRVSKQLSFRHPLQEIPGSRWRGRSTSWLTLAPPRAGN